MVLPTTDLVLLVSALGFVTVDILLALCVRTVLPTHSLYGDWYLVDGKIRSLVDAAAICPCLNGIFPDGTEEKIVFNRIEDKNMRKRSINEPYNNMLKYRYLVSLSIPAYSDDPEEKIFACNGLVQSKEWLLTTENCVNHDSDWYNLIVRSKSLFWSNLGQEHAVTDIVKHFNGFVQLKISPQFTETIVPTRIIKYSFTGNWTYAVSLGWNDRMYQEDLTMRHKFKKFDVEEWTSKNSVSQSMQVCEKCEEFSSKFLLNSCHELIAMESFDKRMCNEFAVPKNGVEKLYKRNQCFMIYKDNHDFNDTEVCQI